MGEVSMVARQTPNLKERVRFLPPMPTACSSAGRILRLGRRGRWFESNHADHGRAAKMGSRTGL